MLDTVLDFSKAICGHTDVFLSMFIVKYTAYVCYGAQTKCQSNLHGQTRSQLVLRQGRQNAAFIKSHFNVKIMLNEQFNTNHVDREISAYFLYAYLCIIINMLSQSYLIIP